MRPELCRTWAMDYHHHGILDLSWSLSISLSVSLRLSGCAITCSYLSCVFISVPPLWVHSLQPNKVRIWVSRLGTGTAGGGGCRRLVTQRLWEKIRPHSTNNTSKYSSFVFLQSCIFSRPHAGMLGGQTDWDNPDLCVDLSHLGKKHFWCWEGVGGGSRIMQIMQDV